jgi:hypothetical protein
MEVLAGAASLSAEELDDWAGIAEAARESVVEWGHADLVEVVEEGVGSVDQLVAGWMTEYREWQSEVQAIQRSLRGERNAVTTYRRQMQRLLDDYAQLRNDSAGIVQEVADGTYSYFAVDMELSMARETVIAMCWATRFGLPLHSRRVVRWVGGGQRRRSGAASSRGAARGVDATAGR